MGPMGEEDLTATQAEGIIGGVKRETWLRVNQACFVLTFPTEAR